MDLERLKLKRFTFGDENVVLMYGMNGTVVPTAICGLCGKTLSFVDKSRKEIAEAVNAHLRHYHKEPLNDSIPTVADLKTYTKDFLPESETKATSSDRGIVLPPDDPLREEVVSLLMANDFILQQRPISVAFWLAPEKETGWVGSTIKIEGFTKSRQGWIGAPTT